MRDIDAQARNAAIYWTAFLAPATNMLGEISDFLTEELMKLTANG